MQATVRWGGYILFALLVIQSICHMSKKSEIRHLKNLSMPGGILSFFFFFESWANWQVEMRET